MLMARSSSLGSRFSAPRAQLSEEFCDKLLADAAATNSTQVIYNGYDHYRVKVHKCATMQVNYLIYIALFATY